MAIYPTGISSFVSSNEYRADPGGFYNDLELLSRADGVKKSYFGYQVEDSAVVFWVNVWKTADPRAGFRVSDTCPRILRARKPVIGRRRDVYDIYLNTNPFEPLGAPVTEFAFITVKRGRTLPELLAIMDPLTQEISVTKYAHSSSWGLVDGRDDAVGLVVGWDTVEAHWDAVKEGPLAEIVSKLKEIADVDLKHAKLSGK